MNVVTSSSRTHQPLPTIPAIKSQRQTDFEIYNKKHPHIYAKLVSLARQAKRLGMDRYSMKSLFENVRWFYLQQATDEPFRLNNNLTSFYARLIMQKERDLRGFFELRALNEDFDYQTIQ